MVFFGVASGLAAVGFVVSVFFAAGFLLGLVRNEDALGFRKEIEVVLAWGVGVSGERETKCEAG